MRLLKIALASVLAVSNLGATATDQSPTRRERLCFIDETAKDPTLVAFKSALSEVVERRDSKGLLNLIAKDVRVDIYDRRGDIAQFVEHENPADPNSPVWSDLGKILDLGGAFIEDNVFCAPYVRCPGSKTADSELFVVILGQRVPAYVAPSTGSRVIEWLSCDVLPFDGDYFPPRPDGPATGWITVFLGTRWGFVEEQKARMVGDRYFHVTKIDGRWLITTYLAG